ncbi:MAG: PD-(D/E)XK nuclease family protein [Aliivibrio sp.]|uniref:PDDEXK-like family protein n=1 Tax=Aliivibrio sp. TaxID=1872443 RepID=UPI001A3660BF|nr:PD-(D/E)XK nuclease family protein [Aliivibrio sp.]
MIDKLLKEISLINLKYEKLQEVTESDFNVFSILRNESDEVALHSRFIGELLNPEGTHNQGEVFQQIFLQQLQDENLRFKGQFSLEVERHMGKHGRVDLLLSGQRDAIVIENKIYAADQPKQLQRYKEALSDYHGSKTKHLYYLTLFGKAPSAESLGSLSCEEVNCISYKTDIKQWLTSCAREVYDYPLLRETIIQYRKLIEKLTGQTLNEDQKVEMKNLLLEGDNFKHALTIEEVITDVKAELQKTIWIDLQAALKSSGYDFSFVNYKFEEISMDVCQNFYQSYKRSSYYGLQYKVLTFGEYSVHLYLEVDHCFYYGFTVCKNDQRGLFRDELQIKESDLKHKLETLIGANNNDEWWLAWKYSSDKMNFKTFQGKTAKLGNPVFREQWISNVTTDVVELLRQCSEIFPASLSK